MTVHCCFRPWAASFQAQWAPRVWGALKGSQLADAGARSAGAAAAREHKQDRQGSTAREGQDSLAMLVLFSSFLLPLPKWYTDGMDWSQGHAPPQLWDVRQDAAFWALIKGALV